VHASAFSDDPIESTHFAVSEHLLNACWQKYPEVAMQVLVPHWQLVAFAETPSLLVQVVYALVMHLLSAAKQYIPMDVLLSRSQSVVPHKQEAAFSKLPCV